MFERTVSPFDRRSDSARAYLVGALIGFVVCLALMWAVSQPGSNLLAVPAKSSHAN